MRARERDLPPGTGTKKYLPLVSLPPIEAVGLISARSVGIFAATALASGLMPIAVTWAQGALPVHDCIASGHGAVTHVLATFCHEYDAAARALAWAFAQNARRKRREKQVGDAGAC